MGLTAFDVDLGNTQGRVPRAPGDPGAGDFALVLGHAQPGVFATVEAGDAVELAQDVSFTGEHIATARVWIRGPAVIPAGAVWWLQWLVDGVVERALPVPVARAVAADFSAIVADLGGTHALALRLSLAGVATPTELELPGVWLDQLELALVDRPALGNPRPAPGERAVPRASSVELELVDPTGTGIELAATRVWIGGELALDASVVQPAFAGPGAGVTLLARGATIRLVPIAPFASQAQVIVQIASATRDGNGHLDAAYAFEIEDRTSPSLIAAYASDLREVELVFDEPVVTTTAAAVTLHPGIRPAVAPAVIELVADGARVRGRLDQPLSVGARYRVEARGIADRSGNLIMAPFDRTWLGPVDAISSAARFPLWRMLPAHLRRSDARGDLRLFVACLQDVTDLLLAEGDRWLDLIDYRRAPEPFLDLILADFGNPFPFVLDVLGKRRLAASLVSLYRKKGTAPGIEQALRFFFGLGARAVPYASRAARLGRARLGRDFRLGASEGFRVYAFDLEVDRVLTDEERRQVRWLVEYGKPAHTHLVRIREPAPPTLRLTWRLGISHLNQTTIVATA